MIKNFPNKKTKIVCIANAFVSSKETGGGDQFLMELARRCPVNLNLIIILPKIGFDHYQKAGIKKDNIHYLVLPSSPFDNNTNPILIFIAYLIRGIQTYLLLNKIPSFDAIHTATDIISDTLPVYLYYLGRRRIFWTARFFHFIEAPLKRKGNLLVNAFSYLLQQLSLNFIKRADLIMIDNPNLLSIFLKKGFKNSQLEIHPGGVDIKTISNVRPNKCKSEAVFIGRLQPHKGVFDAIEIWNRVTSKLPNAKLVMIGHGTKEMMEKLKSEIKKAHLEKNILFTGYIYNREEIYSYCRSSKLLLFLDHEAGFGLVNAEAMAAGIPVVAYDLPIFGSTYKKGYLISPKENVDLVAKNVLEVLTMPPKQSVLSLRAKREALRFDWSRVSRKFYNSIISS
ncbi:MAG: glycosyltransferase family 4 protein [bacterium]|nr:glycosyltransferase family 4 protein [bacterium]